MKKGFTLVELVSVITIIAILSIIAIPPIINQINAKKSEVSKVAQKVLYTAADLYLDFNKNNYKDYSGNVYCITLQTLVDNEFLIEPILDTKTGKAISLDYVAKISVNNKLKKSYEIITDGTCQEIRFGQPAKPELVEGLIPVRWDATGNIWLKADENNPTDFVWYDYSDKKWANAVLVTDATRNDYVNSNIGTEINEDDVLGYFTWIPRYKYKLWNTQDGSSELQEISIVFENKDTPKSNNNQNNKWLTHPAFTFGDTELNGIWVGKFETTGSLEELTVKPNLESISNQTVGSMFTATRLMEKNGNSYGLSQYQVDTHLMKNMEWGAVAYLTNSIYGRCNNGTCSEVWGNNVSTLPSEQYGSTIAGCSGASINASTVYDMGTCESASQQYSGATGVHASTTDNVTGIYDMSGGTWEYVMGNMEDTEGNYYPSESDLSLLQTKYYDSYENNESNIAHERGKLGDATKEALDAFGTTSGGWNEDSSSFISNTSSWFIRGGGSNSGSHAGIFSFSKGTGINDTNIGFRVVIIPEKENRQYAETTLNGATPELYQGMIPVYYENGTAKVANLNEEWYNYTNHNWANAVLVDTSDETIKSKYFNEDMTFKNFVSGNIIPDEDILQYYVWIPRYKYKLWNVNNGNSNPFAIDIVFENKDTEKSTGMIENVYTNGEYYTHPAFTFGNTELNGIWVGKFETTGEITDLTIKPNMTSLTNQTLGAMFNASRAIETTAKFGLSSDEVDTHIIKNMEWGAVAYLSNSIYGRYTNETTCISSGCEIWVNNVNTLESGTNGPTITGCSGASVNAAIMNNMTSCATNYAWNQNGVNASTTGNITGIYDMSGGSWEYVMGNMKNTSGQYYASDSTLTDPGSKYYDSYTNNNASNGYLDHSRGLIGDATKETLKTYGGATGGWNGDYAYFSYTNSPWFVRGNDIDSTSTAGIFAFYGTNGGKYTYHSFRISLTAD